MSSDKVADIYDRLGGIESAVRFLEAAADDTRKDLRAVSDKVTAAQATFNTLKWVFGIFGTVCVLIWTFMASILTLVLKKRYGL